MTAHAARHPRAAGAPTGTLAGILVIAALFATLLLALIGAVLLADGRTAVTAPLHYGKRERAPETIGRASFPLADGKTCREMVFDRHNNDIIDSETRPCRAPRLNDDSWVDMLPLVPPRRATNGFTWGR